MYGSELNLWCFPFSSSVNAFIFKDSIDFCPLGNDTDDTTLSFLCFFEGHLLQNAFYHVVNAQTSFVMFFFREIFLSVLFALSDVASPLFSSFLPFIHLLRVFPFASLVWRLHPGQRRHHPVTWLSRLLPTQPELHVDNRDLPWQRLADKFRVNTCGSQIQFPLQCHFPPPSGLFILPNKLSVDDWSAERLA